MMVVVVGLVVVVVVVVVVQVSWRTPSQTRSPPHG